MKIVIFGSTGQTGLCALEAAVKKGTPNFNATKSSCIKCTVEGVWDKNGRHMSYPMFQCPRRTDTSFRSKLDEDHHVHETPLVELPIDMIEDFIVADSLHLFDLGFSVRAFVRDPAKVPDSLKDKVEIFPGNVLEPDSVSDAIDGMDGVVIALGTGTNLGPTSDMSEGTKNILDSMRAKNVKPVSVCLSAFLFYEPEKVPKVFVDLNEDHKRMYEAVKESPLNWIAVFPPRIEDVPSREVTITLNPTKSPGPIISKWDLGTFLVESLTEPKYFKTVIGIANK